MPDKQSSEERALIDAAIAAGKVTKCPTGTSALEPEYIYDQKLKRLMLKDQSLAPIPQNVAARKSRLTRMGISDETDARRHRLPLLMADGHDAEECARREGVSVEVILKDAAALGSTFDRASAEAAPAQLAAPAQRAALPSPQRRTKPKPPAKHAKAPHHTVPVRPVPPQSQPKPEVTARRAKVAALAKAGKTGSEIAEALGVRTALVYSDIKALPDVCLSHANSAAARHRNDPMVQERRAAVKEAYDGKRTVPDISRLTGVPARSVRDHLEALQLRAIDGKSGRPMTPRDQDVVDARRAQIPAMIEAGKGGREMAEHFGVSLAVIQHDCKKIGARIPRGRRPKPEGKGAIDHARHLFATAHGRFVSTMLQAGVSRADIATEAAAIVAPPSVEDIRNATALRLCAEGHPIELIADVLGMDADAVARLAA